MKIVAKKYLILLAGLIFVTSIFVDPLYHEFSEDEYSQAECQFCKNNISIPTQSNVDSVKIFLSTTLPVEINENFISFNFYNYFSRAPPK